MVSVLEAEEELSTEAFWLGQVRFQAEIAPEFDDVMPDRKVSEVKPEESRFINEDDVLWDVSDHFKSEGFEEEEGWIVYNQTTGYLVVNSNAGTLWALEKRFNPNTRAKNVAVNLEVYQVNDEQLEWVSWAKDWEGENHAHLFTAEIKGRSGETHTSNFEKNEVKLSLGVQPTFSQDYSVDLRIASTLTIEDSEYHLNSGFLIKLGKDYFVELGRASSGLSLLARFKVEAPLVGGPCLRLWHLSETKENTVLNNELKRPEFGDFEIPVKFKARVLGWELASSFVEDITIEPESDFDPFAADDSVKKPEKKKLLAKQQRHRELERCFPNESWLNLRPLLSDSGLEFKEGDYALFGRKNSILVVRSESSELFELVDQMTTTLGPHTPVHFQVVVSVLVEKNGEAKELISKTVLPARSGETASQIIKTGSSELDVEVQPTLGAGGQLVDLRYSILHSSEEFNFNIISATTFLSGISQKILLSKKGGESCFLILQPVMVDQAGRALEEQVY